jgi:putative Mg2+ transporter-C (MgtC) family protein
MEEPTWVSALQAQQWAIALRLFIAALLGAVIGVEREWNGHDAGLRTNMLVAVGSCLFTILSIEGFPVRGNNQDSARIAAQVVSGIGFLGAGALFRDNDRVRGVTTAATIWLVAAIGMAAGAGLFFLAVFSALLTLLTLVVLAPVSARLSKRANQTALRRSSHNPDANPIPAQPHDIARSAVQSRPTSQDEAP